MNYWFMLYRHKDGFFKRKGLYEKIQAKAMEKDIERSKDISEVWLHGEKAIGEIARPKEKQKI